LFSIHLHSFRLLSKRLALRLTRAGQTLVYRRRSVGARLAWPVIYPLAWVWRRTVLRRRPLWAVTGSWGKTSTTAAAAVAAGRPFDLNQPNYGSFLARALLRTRPGTAPLVFEVGISRPGQMRSYARLLKPDLVVLTAIGAEHLRAFHTQDRLAAEKALLPRAVPATGLVLVNGDDPRCVEIGAALAARTLRVGFTEGCDWRLEMTEEAFPSGATIRISGPLGQRLDLRSRWLGPDLPRCAALGAVAALESGVEAAKVGARLSELPPLGGRFQPSPLPGDAWLLDDSWKGFLPTAKAALAYLASLSDWRRIVVLGALDEPQGSQSAVYRELGEALATAADRALFIGPSTAFERLGSGFRKTGTAATLARFASVQAAAAALSTELKPRTVILLKGSHSQKLSRVGLLLKNDEVACQLTFCPARGLRCELCPRLQTRPKRNVP
jgi:UDP-N-acetylmuramoyl-tripeptide--D-alanyl-D-alanine ligase